MSFVISFDEPTFKNLKVLPKNINKQQMESVMKSFTVALGVKCNFCHIRLDDEQKTWDFASDKLEHKKIARDMMKMTAKLNKKYFDVKDSKSLTADLEITCYTCHNGKAHPAKFPSMTSQRPTNDSTKRQ
jgi:hypothetical protein